MLAEYPEVEASKRQKVTGTFTPLATHRSTSMHAHEPVVPQVAPSATPRTTTTVSRTRRRRRRRRRRSTTMVKPVGPDAAARLLPSASQGRRSDPSSGSWMRRRSTAC